MCRLFRLIRYNRLTPFLWTELLPNFNLEKYIERGGFPKSYLATSDNASNDWRENFITTFLERDLFQWSGFSVAIMRRLWTMLAYNNGQLINFSTLSNSLGVNSAIVRNYIDLLEGTFMLEVLPPYFSNLGKRMVKAPRVYISDTGIATSLHGLANFNNIAGHSVFGSLWESLVIANVKGHFPNSILSYYRTSNGAECNIVMEYKGQVCAIECKASKSPSLSKGNYLAFDDIKPNKTFVVAPVNEGWVVKNDVNVVSVLELVNSLKNVFI